MELNFKIWVTHGGEMVFGKGRAQLLEAVERSGSISEAARALGLSYRHAWSMISASEKRLGCALVERSRGGRGGGKARVTDCGRRLLACYRRAEAEFAALAEKKGEGFEDVAG